MANLKALFKDTVIYGLSSIVGRFLNYLLVPLYTASLSAASGGYGIITNIYSYTALLLVILTFGMETTFFRFVNKEGADVRRVYSTTLIAVGVVGLLFLVLVFAFLTPIASALHYSDTPQYVAVMAVCVAFDAFQCIPFAYLRYQRRPIKFAALKLLFITLNIALNITYFVVLPRFYHYRFDVGWVFYINLCCTLVMTLFFWKELTGVRWTLDRALLRRMLSYSWPILVLGIAGILNQTADKILYPLVRGGASGQVELGIYGACVKVAMIMAMITQAFRYAYEPFVFGSSRDRNNREGLASAMKYFLIFTLLAFLMVLAFLDVLKYIIAPDYWEGLRVVPIVMAAEIMMGVYFNLSFWYKLIDKTIWGAWFSGAGCVVLVLSNVLFIPRYGYIACAWSGVAGYGVAMILSYVVGQKKYPIRYPLRDIARYVLLAAVLLAGMMCVPDGWHALLRLAVKVVLLSLFVVYIVRCDFPLHRLPVVGKYFR